MFQKLLARNAENFVEVYSGTCRLDSNSFDLKSLGGWAGS